MEQFGQVGVVEDRLWQVVIGLHGGRRRPRAVKRVQFAESTLGPNAETTDVTTGGQREQIQLLHVQQRNSWWEMYGN